MSPQHFPELGASGKSGPAPITIPTTAAPEMPRLDPWPSPTDQPKNFWNPHSDGSQLRPLPTSLPNLEHGNINAVVLSKQYSHIDNPIMYGHPKFARLMAKATAPRLRMGVGDGQATNHPKPKPLSPTDTYTRLCRAQSGNSPRSEFKLGSRVLIITTLLIGYDMKKRFHRKHPTR